MWQKPSMGKRIEASLFNSDFISSFFSSYKIKFNHNTWPQSSEHIINKKKRSKISDNNIDQKDSML